MAFCDSEFSSENLRFIMEVDKLRDYMHADTVSWSKDWLKIDKELALSTILPVYQDDGDEDQENSIKSSAIRPSTARSILKNSSTSIKSFAKPESSLVQATQPYSSKLSQKVGSRPTTSFINIVTRRASFSILEHPVLKVHGQLLTLTEENAATERPWPSKIVDQRIVEQMVKNIWDTFLSESSHLEICVAPLVVINTVQRIACLDLYGPDVFAEALLEPLRTIQMDTLPRFFASKIYAKMKFFTESSSPLPLAETIEVPPPLRSSLLSGFLISEFENKLFDLNEILQEELLYSEFLLYLKGYFCSENLLCVRMILVFEEQVRDKYYNRALKLAWHICNCFVLPGSAYEVSLLYSNRKDTLLSLARPNIFMFSHLKRSAIKSLEANFEIYSKTDVYLNLSKMMIAVKKREENSMDYFSRKVLSKLPYIVKQKTQYKRS